MEDTPPNTSPRNAGGTGPIVGSIIIVLILVFGAFYFFVTHKEKSPENTVPDENTVGTDESPTITEAEVHELNSELENLNAEFNSFEAELDNLENSEV